jgi:hypothetical protein
LGEKVTMRIEWNWKIIIIIVLAVLLIASNVLQYFVIWGPKEDKLIAAHTEEVDALQATIDSIGPIVSIWAVKDGGEGIFPGKVIESNDLVMKEIPESFINKSFVLNSKSVLGKYYRVAQRGGSLLSLDLVMDEPLDDTVREYDVISSTLPIGLKVGDYVDYRIVYPYGEDYIVLPHKRIDAINGETFKLKLNESEIHIYQAALVDYFLQSQKGAVLYLTKYVEPGIQKPATEYYAVPRNIEAVMTADPNIVNKINAQLNDKARTMIDAGVANIEDKEASVLGSGRSEVKGLIKQGNSSLMADEKAKLDAQAQAQKALPKATPKPSTAPSASSQGTPAPASQATKAPASQTGTGAVTNNPLLNVEKGVVE